MTELTDEEVDMLLERFDQTEPALQRRIIAQLIVDSFNPKMFLDVLAFHLAMDIYVGKFPQSPAPRIIQLRHDLHEEEYTELKTAMDEGNLVEVADAIADSIYVLLGTAISYGIDIRPVWNEVQRTNMLKVGGEIRADGKRLKPEGWQPPDIKSVLDSQRPLI